MIVWGAATSNSVIARAFSCRPMRFLGAISFSLYLIHLPVVRFFAREVRLDLYVELGMMIGIVLLLSWLTYRLIETPMRNVGVQLSAKVTSWTPSKSEPET